MRPIGTIKNTRMNRGTHVKLLFMYIKRCFVEVIIPITSARDILKRTSNHIIVLHIPLLCI